MDLSQIMIATLMVSVGNYTNVEIDENLFRHMCLNSIRANLMKFKDEYGKLVIAADGAHSWRKNVYPYYKANRKKARDESEINWTKVFENLNKVRDELKEYFDFPVIHLDGVEADDVIGVLAKNFNYEKILILSGDKDFQQLQAYPNVEQYSPVFKKYIKCADPDMFLKEHIIRGDVGDGIPNFLSPDNCLVMGTRQKSISSKKVPGWLKASSPTEFCTEEMLRNYKRNELLIDLSKIPDDIQNQILAEYENQLNKPKADLFDYFMTHRLRNLIENIGDFK